MRNEKEQNNCNGRKKKEEKQKARMKYRARHIEGNGKGPKAISNEG